MSDSTALTFVGLDVHRDTIAIALLRPGEHVPLEQTIANTPEALRKQFQSVAAIRRSGWSSTDPEPARAGFCHPRRRAGPPKRR
jgi:hypothetical protein